MTRSQLWRRTLLGLLSGAVLTVGGSRRCRFPPPGPRSCGSPSRASTRRSTRPTRRASSAASTSISPRRCARRCDASCKFVKQRWDRIIPDLVAGKYDLVVSSMSITAERRQKIDFTNPYYQTPAKFVAKKDADLAATLDALKGRKIGVQKATTHEQYLVRQLGSSAEIVRYRDLAQGAGRPRPPARSTWCSAMRWRCRRASSRPTRARPSPSSAPTWSSAAASASACARVSPSWWPTSTARSTQIKADGTYDKIASKYFAFTLSNWKPVGTQ